MIELNTKDHVKDDIARYNITDNVCDYAMLCIFDNIRQIVLENVHYNVLVNVWQDLHSYTKRK